MRIMHSYLLSHLSLHLLHIYIISHSLYLFIHYLLRLFMFISLTSNYIHSYHTNMHMLYYLHLLSLPNLLRLFLDFIHSLIYMLTNFLDLYINLPMLDFFHLALHNMYLLLVSYYLFHNSLYYMLMLFMLPYPTYSLPDTSHTWYLLSPNFTLHLYMPTNMFHFHLLSDLISSPMLTLINLWSLLLNLLPLAHLFTNSMLLLILNHYISM